MFFHWCILKRPVYSLKGVNGNSGATLSKYTCVLHNCILIKMPFFMRTKSKTKLEIFFPSIVLVFRHAVVCLYLWGIFSSYHDSLPFDSAKPRAIIIKTSLTSYLTKSTYFISCMMPVRFKSEIAVEFCVLPPVVHQKTEVFTLKNKDWIVCANKRWLNDSGLALHWKALAHSEDFWCNGEHWTIGEAYAKTQSSV